MVCTRSTLSPQRNTCVLYMGCSSTSIGLPWVWDLLFQQKCIDWLLCPVGMIQIGWFSQWHSLCDHVMQRSFHWFCGMCCQYRLVQQDSWCTVLDNCRITWDWFPSYTDLEHMWVLLVIEAWVISLLMYLDSWCNGSNLLVESSNSTRSSSSGSMRLMILAKGLWHPYCLNFATTETKNCPRGRQASCIFCVVMYPGVWLFLHRHRGIPPAYPFTTHIN